MEKGHFIYNDNGEKFCKCYKDNNGRLILDTKKYKISLDSLLSQVYGSKK